MITRLLQPGERFAGHQIVRHLASGTSAEIYVATAPSGGTCALKIMTVDKGVTPKQQERFGQEGVALTLVVHPSVVRLLDAGSCGAQVWLSLELVEGETLTKKLAAGRPPLDELLHWFQQVCDGLAEAHRVGVVHRNLSPDNILVMPGGAVKVIDFGGAKLRSWSVATTRDRQVGAVKYAPAEQWRGADAHAGMDVYALGHVLYEAIAGVHAMGSAPRTMVGVVQWHMTETPRPLRELLPDVPYDIEKLIHEAIDRDPEKRPTMRAFHHRLRDARAPLRVPQRRAARNAPPVERENSMAPTIPMAAVTEPARSTDVPVESAVGPSRAAPRRALSAGLVLGALVLAGIGWTVLGRMPGSAPAAATEARPAASAPAPALASPPASSGPAAPMPAASALASASAPAKPARTPPRSAPALRAQAKPPALPVRAKNRTFGVDE